MRRYLMWMMVISLAACSGDPAVQDKLLDMEEVAMRAKVLVIGFDGATWDMFKPAMEQGKMPRLKNLVDEGVRAPLETIKPTLTPVVWTTIATGRLPEDHGVHGVVDRDPVTGEMHPLTSRSVRVKAIWDMMTVQNRTATVIRWPVTWPIHEINGEMISDFAFQTTRPQRVWPQSLASLVDTRRVDYRLKDIQALTGINRDMYQQLQPMWQWKLMVLLREYVLDVQFKDIAKVLFEQKQRDLMTVYFYSLDALGHNYYKFINQNPQDEQPDYQALVMNWCWLYDQFLSEILDAVDPST
ncbi:MAG TPA: alkaline phosphatase family protein, partial [bacterium]|nr:alkaline phosphatase family protein [bacterium]